MGQIEGERPRGEGEPDVTVWMDQGGTFTDVVRVDADGGTSVQKVLSDRADLEALAAGATDARRGTTVATNALLEGTGAPVLLLTTAGFGDLPWIGDQTRPELFALHIRKRAPPCAAVLPVTGRIGATGSVMVPHSLDELALAAHFAQGIRAVAVVLVHGPMAPEEERRLGARCRRMGFTTVSLGHEVAPSRGFLSRLQTTLVDASLSPLLPRTPGAWLRSDGGLAREDGSGGGEWRGCHAVLSGPAGGVVAVAALARRLGLGPAFGLDMGGTSTDVSRVEGAPERVESLSIAGLCLRVPAVRLETVAAGGGSRLHRRAEGYAAGPDSAGADPGPAAYGRGGPATVTDCEAVLGRLPTFPDVCGPERDQPLQTSAARDALECLDSERPVEGVAAGFRAVAHETMAGAVRALAARLGVDPADHTLVAFGGAGPGHACGVARRLGVRRVVVPALASVFSAVGIGAARRRAEVVVPVVGAPKVALQHALAALPFPGDVDARLAMRHQGTLDALEVPVGAEMPPMSALRAAFDAVHRDRYGFARPDQGVESVEVRVAVEGPIRGPEPRLERDERAVTTTRAWFDGWRDVPLVPLAQVRQLSGPALVTAPGTTVTVDAGWVADYRDGALFLDDLQPLLPTVTAARHPVHSAVFAARLQAVAEQMGEQLTRLARSVSIRERRDFSCAVFDGDGRLVVNAPHVPVHLGAMGATVRALLSRHGPALAPGQAWLCNDPFDGGSHLPDITVMTPVYLGPSRAELQHGETPTRIGFVACRGHHVDVGGIAPGSMPPDARDIAEEGVVLGHHLFVEEGRTHAPDLGDCRQPDDVLADLHAQAAACRLGASALRELADTLGPDVVAAQMGYLFSAAEGAVREVLRGMNGVHRGREVLDDGTPIDVRLDVEGDEAVFTVDGPRHPGNRNAPRAVVRAALLYVFRCLVDHELPLNEGALVPFRIQTTAGGLFAPASPSAVCGGNVETSQRLVDALLLALGACAASQGTMNNLTVGTRRGAWYETIGGGAGAGPGFAGAHAVQVHMTNTRATDVEELESRFPVVLEAWRRRRGSGGAGAWAGGDGVEKVWRFLEVAEVAMMAERRGEGARGAMGGEAGLPGEDARDCGEGFEPAPNRWMAQPGDRLRVRTPGGGGWGVEQS
jgi:5-oxoprolinase (ATP-hydrolysing)